MPISNLSNGLRTGVCTSTNRPTTPYEGQVIFETDTDRLYVYNGTAWVIPNSPAQNPQGLEFISTTSLSSTSTNIVGCFNATYRDYLVTLNGVACNAGNAIWYRMLQGTTQNSGSYYYSFVGLTSGGASEDVANAAFDRGYCGFNTASSGTSQGDARLHFRAPYESLTTRVQVEGVALAAGAYTFRTGQSSHDTVASYDGFKIFTDSAATFSSGTVTVYGYRQA